MHARKPVRLAFSLLLVLLTVAALAALPAVGQTTTTAPSGVFANTAAAPATYHPASAALAPPAPAPAPAAGSSDGPDPDRRWEIELHGGFILSSNPRDGTAALPPPGPTFTDVLGAQTRAVPSFFFGDGALLTNQFTTALGDPNLLAGILPLDPVLTGSAVNRQHGFNLGARFSRELTPRFGLELNFDYNSAGLHITRQAQSGIIGTASSFQRFFTQINSPPVCPTCTAFTASAVPTIHNDEGHQLFLTGGINVNLVKEGPVIPYLSGGVGIINNMGDTPFVSLVGDYQYTFAGQTYHAMDLVTLRYAVDDHVFTGYFGGGVKYYVTPRWGIRVDVRDNLSENSIRNLLDANGSEVQVGAGGSCAAFGVTPDIQDCNNPAVGAATLSGAPFVGFRTFNGSGIRHQVQFSGGIFWRF